MKEFFKNPKRALIYFMNYRCLSLLPDKVFICQ